MPTRFDEQEHKDVQSPLRIGPASGKLGESDALTKDGMMGIKFLHTMVRVKDLDASMHFFCDLLGLEVSRRYDSEEGRFTLVHLSAPGQTEITTELTYNWDGDDGLPSDSRHFGHLAFEVDNIYETCQFLMENGVIINRPPHDGRMAFVRSPDNVSIEFLQAGAALPKAEPWASMKNTGHW